MSGSSTLGETTNRIPTTDLKPEDLTKKLPVINKLIGEIGKYQIMLFLMSAYPVAYAGIFMSLTYYGVFIPKHRCFVPGCDTNSTEYEASFVDYAFPQSNLSLGHSGRCEMFAKVNDGCTAESFDHKNMVPCNGNFIYDTTEMRENLATKYNLVCGDEAKLPLIQSVFFLGVFIGAFVFGYIADLMGRKFVYYFYPPILVGVMVCFATVTNLYLDYVLTFIMAAGLSGTYQSAYVIGIENAYGRFQFWFGNLFSVDFSIGVMFLCAIAIYTKHWDEIMLILAFVYLGVCTYWYFYPESIRWLISQRRFHDAATEIVRAGKMNGRKLDFNQVIHEVEVDKDKQEAIEKKLRGGGKKRHDFIALFTHPVVGKWALVMMFLWACNAFIYYGLLTMAGGIGLNFHISFTVLSFADIPSILIETAVGEYLPRRFFQSSMFLVGGVTCIVAAFIPETSILKAVIAFLGKCFIAGAFGLIFVFTTEIFPTVVRTSTLGFCAMCARIATVITPWIRRTEYYYPPLPFLILGSFGILAAAMCFLLPETKDRALPDTFADSVRLAEGNPIKLEKSKIAEETLAPDS